MVTVPDQRRGSLLAAGKIATKRSSPTAGSADLKAALATLNEDTMAEACALLLTDTEDEQHQHQHQLRAILAKCQEAHAIIQEHSTQTTATALPLLPLTRGPAAPGVRQNAAAAMQPPRRTAKAGPDRRAAPPKLLVRQGSDSSLASGGSAASSHKKPRLEQAGPPPEALSFLQALNARKDKDRTSPTTASHPNTRPVRTMQVKPQPKRTAKR
jgi:hypothetical protein